MEPLALIALLATTGTTADTAYGYLLVVSDVEGAIVRVDDQRVGSAPVPTVRIPAGRHVVIVEISGYGRYAETVDVRANELVRVDAVVSPRAILKPSPAERLGIQTKRGENQGPVITRPWFWAVAGGIAVSVLAVGFVLASGGDYLPEGELGNSSTADWRRF